MKVKKVVCVLLIMAALALMGCNQPSVTVTTTPTTIVPSLVTNTATTVLSGGKNQTFGPTNVSTDATAGTVDFNIPSINLGDKVDFDFTVQGGGVTWSVRDPSGMIIASGMRKTSDQGSFVDTATGTYKLHFVSGDGSVQTITLNGTITPAK
jgi:uncharacterized lipoprotein NlpE involved in copper resistance